MHDEYQGEFAHHWRHYADYVHAWAKRKGFWGGPRNDAEALMLMVTELGEACEALRAGNPADDKIPEFDGVTAELADCVIRIMDYSAARDLRVGEAIVAKMAHNETRPHKHGKAF